MAEAGGGVKRRCGSNDSSKRCYCLPRCSDILPGCSCVFSRSLAVSGFPSSRSWVFGGYLPLFLCFFFFFFSSRFLSSFQSSLLCFFRFLLLPPPFSLLSVLGVLFIEPRAWLCCGAWGATGRSAIGHDCQGPPPPLGFLVGARWVVGHYVRSVGSRRESGRQKFKKKLPFFLLPRNVIGGRR